ncbi:hypothetical protein FE633_12835 [Streptomyces montanus]|uniref:Uncharacterized protein n=1 Tax=Streptomyces montanus TaxID=2580423 RepID=A0A5R9FNZ7_9ACTN|nr:hypothetical protein [Streptomyces montanus]TLS45657.1 hypothetical protein FE633_12835 [Streptomyces montanus]
MEWMTLVSAGVGAIIATASAAVLERGRWRRESRERETAARRVLYGEYLACLSEARNGFRSLARDTSLPLQDRAVAARGCFAPCYGLRYQMTITAPHAVVEASEDAFRRLRDVRNLAAEGALSDSDDYAQGRGRYEDALTRLRAAMRTDIGADAD